MPTRAVTILCLAQVLFLVLAWMLTSKFLRIAERFHDGFSRKFYPTTLWFRDYGLLLLLAPVAVAYFCVKLSETHRDIALVGEDGTRLAIASTVIVALYSAYVALSAFGSAFNPIG